MGRKKKKKTPTAWLDEPTLEAIRPQVRHMRNAPSAAEEPKEAKAIGLESEVVESRATREIGRAKA